MNPHNHLSAVSPRETWDDPNTKIWQCNYCGAEGTADYLDKLECAYVYPPCGTCGQTPLCAPDCGAIGNALANAFNYSALNPGIREVVRFLRDAGFDTCDSGDGETHEYECDRDCPYVVVVSNREELLKHTDQIAAMFTKLGFDVNNDSGDEGTPMVCCNYTPNTELEALIDISGIDDHMLEHAIAEKADAH